MSSVIRQIEEATGDELGEIESIDAFSTSSSPENRYVLDEEGHVVALRVSEIQIDLSLLGDCSHLRYLYLFGCEISDVHPLATLTSLTELSLRDNKITDLEPLGELANLTELDLGGNQIMDVGPLGDLTNLTRLDLVGNQITDVGPLGDLTNLTRLNLVGNQIADVKPLGDLTNLMRLNLGANQIMDVKPLGGLTDLLELYLTENQITDIGPLEGLTDLTELNLRANQIVDIGPLEGLTDLKKLDLVGNQITDVGPLGDLTNLTRLDLGDNQITDVRPLGDLTDLMSLNLRANQIADIGPLEGLTDLTELNLQANQIVDIGPLEGLTDLTRLNLGGNQIADVKPLGDLTNLTRLNLGGNQITDVRPLGDLTDLMSLNLRANKIVDVGPLEGLTDLTILYLGGNQITDIGPLLSLTDFDLLDLRENEISHLSDRWFEATLDLKWESKFPGGIAVDGIYLEGNPLEYPPPEILKEGEDAIHSYRASLAGERHPLNEVRMLLVGDGAAGKTSLMKRLLGEPFDEDQSQTHGINIRRWDVELPSSNGMTDSDALRAHLWDFGGQEIMHATHQFFLSKRSLYIVVLDGRRDEQPEYWLKHVQNFGGDSPILVVLNKKDENRGHDINRKSLLRKYPNIVDFYPLSCKTDYGLKDLEAEIKDTLAGLNMRRMPFAENWGRVKAGLADMETDYIRLEDFREMCREEGITDRHAQRTLLSFLDRLGVVLHFEDFELPDTHVLNPEWLTNAVYDVINHPMVAENGGELALEDVPDILDVPRGEQRFVIGMMKKFELCYELDDGRVLIPDLLPKQEPDHPFDLTEAPHYFVDYDFLPPSLFPRFVVQSYQEIQNPEMLWRTGVVLWDPTFDARALVSVDEEDRKLSIWVEGDREREYFATLRKRLRDLHAEFDELGEDAMVPLPKDSGEAVAYEALLGHEDEGRPEYFHGKTRESYDVAELLNGIIRPEDRERRDRERDDRGPDVRVEQTFQQTIEQQQENVQRTDVDVNVEVKNENVQHFEGTLTLLREDLRDALGEEANDRLGDELDRVEGALTELQDEDNRAEAIRSAAVKRLRAFVEKLDDTSTRVGSALQTLENGVQHAQNLAEYYNSIAQWCGLTQVPKPLLGNSGN
ncbi:leucine-rich repeat domain-containing protein [Salinibacter ruber]|uniref:leucine-rich repeat domain-containing protein n=1 Tax=Salinibacter ruber TaxID=146919 RepID=UPI002167AFB6|nr:leucine-rich repeat domain-containing protein [Salinibacter ruber]MCS3685284.1 small GTP-binding protein [Salinibacter ruber]